MNFQSVFLRLFLLFVKLRFVLLVSCLYYVIDSSEKRNNLKDYKILGKKARFGRSGFTATIDWILMGQAYSSVPHLGTDFKGPLVDSPLPFDFIKERSEGQKHIFRIFMNRVEWTMDIESQRTEVSSLKPIFVIKTWGKVESGDWEDLGPSPSFRRTHCSMAKVQEAA